MKDNKISVLLVIISLGILFYIINILTPEYIDDYAYKYMFSMCGIDYNQPIENVSQIAISQYNHYFVWNGRIVVHSIVQLFSAIFGKNVFNVFNTLVFISLSWMLALLQGGGKASYICFGSAIIVLLFPAFNDTVLWMTGSIGYLWSVTSVLFFLILLKKWKDQSLSWASMVFVSVISFFVGALHEGITFPLSFSLLFCVVAKWREYRNNYILLPIFLFFIGALFCAFSPATLTRGAVNSNPGRELIVSKLINGVFLLFKLRAFYVLVLFLLYIWVKKGWKVLLSFWQEEMVLFNAWILSFGIIFLSGFAGVRTAIGEEIFSIFLILKLLTIYVPMYFNKIRKVTCTICLFLYIAILYFSIHNYINSKFILSQIKNSPSSIILTDGVEVPDFLKSFIVPPFVNFDGDYYDAFTYSSGWNKTIARFYHREDSIVFIPKQVYNDIHIRNERVFDIKKQGSYPFYIVPVKIQVPKEFEVKYVLYPANFAILPFYIRPFASRMMQYTVSEIDIKTKDIITVDENQYLCLGKNYLVDDRVKYIDLKNYRESRERELQYDK